MDRGVCKFGGGRGDLGLRDAFAQAARLLGPDIRTLDLGDDGGAHDGRVSVGGKARYLTAYPSQGLCLRTCFGAELTKGRFGVRSVQLGNQDGCQPLAKGCRAVSEIAAHDRMLDTASCSALGLHSREK